MAFRAPITVILPVASNWEKVGTCLDVLRPTLGPRDQVLLVAHSPEGAPLTVTQKHPWAQPVGTGSEAFDQCIHEVLVFLDPDCRPGGQWIDPLVRVISDEGVGAAGPRTNQGPEQQVAERSSYTTLAQMRRFTRDWSQAHRGRQTGVDQLGTSCVAIPRSVLVRLHGDGTLPDWPSGWPALAKRMKQEGLHLVVADDSYVHWDGAVHGDGAIPGELTSGDDPGILVSACLIVKDEEDVLGDCLESLQGFADEVVVYDTGSTDGTVELARGWGATVIEGYWDDDFSRARNACLDHCSGAWIAWLDADETLQTGDKQLLRERLRAVDPSVDGWGVPIHNLSGSGVGAVVVHTATRMFRRSRCCWHGRLHEQIVRRGSLGAIVQADPDPGLVWLRHTGYLDEVAQRHNKAERNLRVAEAEVEEDGAWDRSYALTNLARSYVVAQRFDEALDSATAALEMATVAPIRRLALRTAIDATSRLGRFDEALSWCTQLRQEGGDANSTDAIEAGVLIAAGRYAEGLELISGVDPERVDSDGFASSRGWVANNEATALAGLERYGEATDVLLTQLYEDGVLDLHIGSLVENMKRAGQPLTRLVGAIPNDQSKLFFAQICQLRPEIADEILSTCLEMGAHVQIALASGASIAKRMPVDQALIWSIRLRQAGRPQVCPLIAIASSPARPPIERCRAAATAMAAFSDARATELFEQAFRDAAPDLRDAIRLEASQLCPGLVSPAVVVGEPAS